MKSDVNSINLIRAALHLNSDSITFRLLEQLRQG